VHGLRLLYLLFWQLLAVALRCCEEFGGQEDRTPHAAKPHVKLTEDISGTYRPTGRRARQWSQAS
jgi:hypothetical protein